MSWFDQIKQTLASLKQYGSVADAERVKTEGELGAERVRKENEENQKMADKAQAEYLKEQERIKKDALDAEKLRKAQWDAKIAEIKAKQVEMPAATKSSESESSVKKKPKTDLTWLTELLRLGGKEKMAIPSPTSTPLMPTSTPTPVGVGDTNGISGYSRGSIDPQYVKMIMDAIATLGTGTSVTPALLASSLNTESGFIPDAYNNGDRGIGQFSTRWRPDITDEVAYNPSKAIPEVAKTLNDYIGNTGNIAQGVAAYNVGQGRVGIADGRNQYGLGPKGMEYIKKIAANLSKQEAQKLGLDIFQ